MKAPEDLRGLAGNGLREIAARELKASGPRLDAVFYLLDALQLFRGKSLEEVREIAFGSACWKYGWTLTTSRRRMSCGRCLVGDKQLSLHLFVL